MYSSSELQQVKLLLQDLVIAKDDIEKLTEELVKKVLDKDDPAIKEKH